MMLITKEIEKLLPALNSQDGVDRSWVKVPLKLFNPTGIGTWYITEMDPENGWAFGWCDLGFPELGYVSVKDLQELKLPYGLSIERDIHWDPNTTLDKVMNGEVN